MTNEPSTVVPQQIRDVLATEELQAVTACANADARIVTFLEETARRYSGDALRTYVEVAILGPIVEGDKQRKTQDEIDRGSWVIRAFDDGPPTPLYAHTVGLSIRTGVELFISGLAEDAINAILNDLSNRLINNPSLTVSDLNPPLVYINNTKPGRVKVETIPLNAVNPAYISTLRQHVNPRETDSLMVIVLPDENNHLPGEDGYDNSFQQLLPDQLRNRQ